MDHITETLEKFYTLVENDSPKMKECLNAKCRYYDSEEHSNCTLEFIRVNGEGTCTSFKTKPATPNKSKAKPETQDKEPNFEWDEHSRSYKRVR